MPDRPLNLAWPPVVDSSGGPSSGTKLNADLFDSMREAVEGAIYDPDLDDGPPETTAEVVKARGAYADLDARLDAVETAAAGGAATFKADANLNFIWNDTLLWSGGDSAAPDGWVAPAGMNVARIAAQPTPLSGPASAKAGRNIISLVNTDATVRDFYFDVVPGASLAAHGNAPLAGAGWAGGVWIYSATPGLVTVYLEDANGSGGYIGQQGTTTGAWVWSANGAYDGGRTLGASPTRLRFIVRMTAAGTAYICGSMCGPGGKSTAYVPPPIRRGQWTFGLGPEAALATGIKSRFYVNRYALVNSGRVLAVTAGAASGATVTLEKGGVDIFNSVLVIAATLDDSTALTPHTVAKASVKPGDLLEFRLSAVAADLRGITAAIDYLEPEILTDAYFGGGKVF